MSDTATPTAPRATPRTKIGIVLSDKRDKTRTVAVTYQTRHPKYGKYLQRQAKYHVHDAENTSKIGDRVEIATCRPISKNKSWRLTRILQQALTPVEHKSDATEE